MSTNKVNLSIFDTFKTKNMDLTAKAMRQRAIISALSDTINPMEKTRTAITRRITDDKKWKNTYSGVFLDMEKVLVPLGLVREDGRMPLKRGPKALQEKGVPYYGLTQKGSIVAMALIKTANKTILAECFIEMNKEEKQIKGMIDILYKISPKLVQYLFKKYVKAYCEGQFDSLTPLNFSRFNRNDEFMNILDEFLTNMPKIHKSDNMKIHDLIHELSNKAIH